MSDFPFRQSFADIPKTYTPSSPTVREWYRDWRDRLHQLEWSEEEMRSNYGGLNADG